MYTQHSSYYVKVFSLYLEISFDLGRPYITVGDRSWHSIDDANVVLGALVGVMAAPIAICALLLVIPGESIDKKRLQMGSPLGT